jgi:hypothetical protein
MNCEMDGETNALWDYEHEDYERDPHKNHVWLSLEHPRKWLVDK